MSRWLMIMLIGIWLISPTARVIDYDRGGKVLSRAAKIEAGGFVTIRGYCASACTMHLANGCVMPEALLVFHLPSVDVPYWRSFVAGYYPAAIAEWFMALPQGAEPTAITGTEAVRWGAHPC